MAIDFQWLERVREPALDPARSIIDPHHHLWDHPGHPYMLTDLLADFGTGEEAHNITHTVFVECMAMYRVEGPEAERPLGETEFVNGIAAQSASGQYGPARVCAGIVSFVDLTLGEQAGPLLEAHQARAPERFKGIRHASGYDASAEVRNSHTNPPPGLLGDETFRKGFAQLEPLGLSFDAWLYHHQIPELTALAQAFPETTIILDHFGGPLGIGPYETDRAEIFEQWKRDIADLSRCENVYAKLGGLNMAINGWGWHKRQNPPSSEELAAATKDYYLHTIDCFGPKRCMFESNFPVDKLSCSYGVLWNAFKRMAAYFSDDEKDWLFRRSAATAYRLAV